jgi:galactitol-specific phosphotransferase system IIB component
LDCCQIGRCAEERNIDADISEVKVVDLALVAENYDLIVSASELSDIYNVPVVASSSIITGIGFDETLEKIIKKLEEVKDKK